MLSDQKPAETSTGQPQDIIEDEGFWNPNRVRLLAMSVIFMSFLLLAGFGMVVYKLIEKTLTLETPRAEKQLEAPAKPLDVSTKAIDFTLKLEGFKITNMNQSGKWLTLHLEKPASSEIWIVDTGKGVIKTRIQIK